MVARSAHVGEDVGSNPASRKTKKFARVAQRLEREIENLEVSGSIPLLGISKHCKVDG